MNSDKLEEIHPNQILLFPIKSIPFDKISFLSIFRFPIVSILELLNFSWTYHSINNLPVSSKILLILIDSLTILIKAWVISWKWLRSLLLFVTAWKKNRKLNLNKPSKRLSLDSFVKNSSSSAKQSSSPETFPKWDAGNLKMPSKWPVTTSNIGFLTYKSQ